MKRRIFAFVIPLLAASAFSLSAQDSPAALTLTVDQAVDYALAHNRSVASARYDMLASDKSYLEALSAGLPSVSGSVGINDNLKLMTTLLPGEIFGQPGVKLPVTFGSKYNTSFGVTASTAIFSAPWIIGMKTAKLATDLAEKGLEQTETNTSESVMTVYYLILVSQETLKVIEANLDNLNEILASTKAMYSVGMAEATDVDQMQSTVSTLINTKASMQRALEVNYNLMRFMLGVPRETELNLTETLDIIIEEINVKQLLGEDFSIEDNIDYKLIEGQVRMSELSLSGAKAAVLPSLAGSIYYNKGGQGDKLNDLQWFPNSVLGFQLSIPIFDSGERHAKISKAKINLEKAHNTRAMVTDQLLMQEKELRFNLQSASEQYGLQKENIEIASRVFKSFENKYNQGMASSLDLTQANNNYLTAQNNYLSALMNLLQTKVAFDKLMNKL
ncbi:MAG: TolC family protein [Bacteroidales bacterium]